MRTIANTATGSVMGLAVVAAMFIVIWVAGDSSAGTDVATADANEEPSGRQSARTARTPVTHTSITPGQLRQLQQSAGR